jgi:calnexin
MRFSLLILFACLLNVTVIRCNDDDDGTDEEITIEDSTKKSAPAATEKGNVPTIKSSSSNIFFEEQFQDKSAWSRWSKSLAKKDGVDEILAKYDGEWAFEVPHSSAYQDDYSLILKVHRRISLRTRLKFTDIYLMNF